MIQKYIFAPQNYHRIDYRGALKLFGFNQYERKHIFDIDTEDLEIKINEVWKKKAFELHPDTNGSEEQFKILNQAYQRLKLFLKEHHSRTYGDAMDYLIK